MIALEKILAGLIPVNLSLLPVAALADIVRQLRPVSGKRANTAQDNLSVLCHLLDTNADYRAGLQRTLSNLLRSRRSVLLFATSGIYPATGMLAELNQRIAYKFLPEADDASQMKMGLGQMFNQHDVRWLQTIPVSHFVMLLKSLRFDEMTDRAPVDSLSDDLVEAMRIIAHRIAGSGLEPEILRLYPDLEKRLSPFLAQCEEALDFIKRFEQAALEENERHYLILLEQCHDTIRQVRSLARKQGASFHLTFQLLRLEQHLERVAILFVLIRALGQNNRPDIIEHSARFLRDLIINESRRNNLRHFWKQNIGLVALRVTENASYTGEHYIAESRSAWMDLLWSAIGGGFIIALMAGHKIFLGGLNLPPLVTIMAYCLNYGLGFVLIHLLHFSVATKQPAMTASTLAAAIEQGEMNNSSNRKNPAGQDQTYNLDPLAELVVCTIRSQFAAITGNVSMAIPVAILLSLAAYVLTGQTAVSPEKSHILLAELNPVASGSVIYAAIAGVCLFLAGLITGYYDNLCVYNRIPERLFQLSWPGKILGIARWKKIVNYTSHNLGVLAGNFCFGFLLGGTTGIGLLSGLPIDIRHVAFSSANLGYAFSGIYPDIEPALVIVSIAGVAIIGLVNMMVSFYLALWVGLRARGVSFHQRYGLGKTLARHFLRHPRDFFFPPRDKPAST